MADYAKFLFDAFSGPGEAIQEKRNYAAKLQEVAGRNMRDDRRFGYQQLRDQVGDQQFEQTRADNRSYRDALFGLQARTAERQDTIAARPQIETFYEPDTGREVKGIYDPESPSGFRPVGGTKNPTGTLSNGYQTRPDGTMTYVPGGPADPEVVARLAGARGSGDGSGAKPLPAEIGARIGLGNQFINVDLPAIREEITKGTLGGKGLLNNAGAMFQMSGGFGKAGEINRRIQTGLDALRRNLTGQGMSASEAQDYVNRYVPGVADSVKTINSKLDGLEADLNATAAGATAGRVAPPSMMPNAPRGAPTYQRQDIEAEMRRRGIM